MEPRCDCGTILSSETASRMDLYKILIGHRGKEMQWAGFGNASFVVTIRFPAAPHRST